MSLNNVYLPSALAAVLVALPVSAVQQPAQRPAQAPTFRSGISLVPIDVRVVDREGKPITDLKQEDFTIFEDGVPQTIRNFSSTAFTAVRETGGAVSPLPLRDETVASSAENRRVFLIVMGRGRHQDVSNYVDATADFVGSLLPQDHVAVLAWNRATDFTTDHEVIRRTLLKYRDEHARIEADLKTWFLTPRGANEPLPARIQKQIDNVFAEAASLRPRPLAPAQVAESQQTDRDIKRTAEDLRRNALLTERRAAGPEFKSLPDIGAELTAAHSGLTFDEFMDRMTETMQDVGNLYAAVGYLRFLAGEKHLIFVTRDGIPMPRQEGNASLARVAADARIALELIQTGGVVTAGPPIRVPTGGIILQPWPTTDLVLAQHLTIKDLQLMADRTGGQLMAFKTGNDAFRRLEEMLKFQYLLGYSPTNAAIDNRFRKVVVKVNRPGARVLAREGYVATESPVVPDRREMITFNRIRSAAEHASVVDHLKVRLAKPAVTQTGLSVEVSVDISKLVFENRNGRREAELEVALFAGGADGTVVGEKTQRVELRLGDAEFERASRQGVKFTIQAPLKKPARSLKVIVYNYAADLIGSAVVEDMR